MPQPDFPYCDGELEEILRPFEINMRVYTLLCMKKKDRAIQVSLKLKPNFIAWRPYFKHRLKLHQLITKRALLELHETLRWAFPKIVEGIRRVARVPALPREWWLWCGSVRMMHRSCMTHDVWLRLNDPFLNVSHYSSIPRNLSLALMYPVECGRHSWMAFELVAE